MGALDGSVTNGLSIHHFFGFNSFNWVLVYNGCIISFILALHSTYSVEIHLDFSSEDSRDVGVQKKTSDIHETDGKMPGFCFKMTAQKNERQIINIIKACRTRHCFIPMTDQWDACIFTYIFMVDFLWFSCR